MRSWVSVQLLFAPNPLLHVGGDPLCHDIKIFRQLPKLVLTFHVHMGIQISLLNLIHGIMKYMDRLERKELIPIATPTLKRKLPVAMKRRTVYMDLVVSLVKTWGRIRTL